MASFALAFSPLRDASPADILAWARRAEDLGFAGVFVPESFNDEETQLRQAVGEDEWPMVAVAIHTGLRAVQPQLGARRLLNRDHHDPALEARRGAPCPDERHRARCAARPALTPQERV